MDDRNVSRRLIEGFALVQDDDEPRYNPDEILDDKSEDTSGEREFYGPNLNLGESDEA